jgi:uncharacterized protein (TIGR03118 family)
MRSLLVLAFATASLLSAGPLGFVVHPLASDATDSNLINAWGLDVNGAGSSPWWIGANGSGKALVYRANGAKVGLEVTIPHAGNVTGLVGNGNAGAGDFNGDAFLFASEDGTISGWRNALGTMAETLVSPSPAVYKGLAFGLTGGFGYLYGANFAGGTIDVFKGNSAAAPNLTGNFTDPNLPAGYAPFNIQNIGGTLYVAYAAIDPANPGEELPGVGKGFVDAFDLNGILLGRVVSDGALNAPWGLAIAPSTFGGLGGSLLVGNFGDGLIHAYDLTTGNLVETLSDRLGNPLVIDGLWALQFGHGTANNGPTDTLFFTAGPADETGGLFGNIVPAPEPATWIFAAAGLLACAVKARYRSK